MNLKIQEYKKKIEEFKHFIDHFIDNDNKKNFQEKELLDWISQCVSLFAELKVNDEIIREFMKTFEFEIDGVMGNLDREGGIFDKCPSQDVYYIKLAFTAAEAIIERTDNEDRLVPKAIINSLSENIKHKHIVSSLELMEKYYHEKDADALVKNSLTLLDSILELEKNLSGKQLSKKLKSINNQLMQNFGLTNELIYALDNNRLIRNSLIHKNLPIKLNIPFLVSLGCAYLVIMILESAMYAGVYF